MRKSLSENYFGQDLFPLEIVKTNFGNIYICEDNKNNIQVYNSNGEGAMELSSIDIEEFEKIIKENLE